MEFASARFAGDALLEEILNDPDTGTKKLQKGSPEDSVIRVQTALFDLKWALGTDFATFVDGDYGPATESAVLAYKQEYDIHFPPAAPVGSYDGFAGPRTLRRLDGQCVLWDEAKDAISAKVQELAASGITFDYDPVFPTPIPLTRTHGVLQPGSFGGGSMWILQTHATGAHPVYGNILVTYAGIGFAKGPLGFPTTDEYDDGPGFRRADFEHGSLRCDLSTGVVETLGTPPPPTPLY